MLVMEDDDVTFEMMKRVGNTLLERDSPQRHFFFVVDNIGKLEDADYDVKTDELIAAYQETREYFKNNQLMRQYKFWEWIKASEYQALEVYKRTASDSIKTESYANGASFWQKIFDGRIFGTNHDDSVTVNAIQTATKSDMDRKTDEDLMDEYALSEEGVADLRAVMNAVDDTYISVVFHYLETDYSTYSLSVYGTSDSDIHLFDGDAYIAYNAIIDEFNIIELQFGEDDTFRTVPTVHPTLTYIGSLEGDEKLEDETFDPIKLPSFGDWWDKATTVYDKAVAAFRIVGCVLFGFVVFMVVSMIVRFYRKIRDNFGR